LEYARFRNFVKKNKILQANRIGLWDVLEIAKEEKEV
jgi:hypothetical protein